MVHKHRQSQKATMAKDISPVRGGLFSKYAADQQRQSFGARLAPAVAPARSLANAEADKWKWNAMISEQREKFNSLHHC